MINKSNILDWIIATNQSKENDKNELVKILKEMNFEEFLTEKEAFFFNASTKANGKEKFIAPAFLDKKRQELRNFLKGDFRKGSICAPTSFGKSFIIKQHIKNCVENKALIITPTLALCNEYFISMVYKDDFNNKSISMSPTTNADIYILTPEKLIQLFEFDKISEFDFVVFDEFYEAFSERFFVFSEAFKQCECRAKKIVTIFPKKVEMIPRFTNKNFVFETDDSATTRKFTKYLLNGEKGWEKYVYSEFDNTKLGGFLIEKGAEDLSAEQKILEIIRKNSDKQIIVLTSKSRMYELTGLLSINKKLANKNFIIDTIEQYINGVAPNLVLKKGILSGVAYHNGSTDKFLRTLIEVAFESKNINVLFSNSTITKGVNLNPDILIIDQTIPKSKVPPEMRKIEFINAVGRAGRTILMRNIVGNVVLIRRKNSRSEVVEDEQLVKISNTDKIQLAEPVFEKIEIPANIEQGYKKHFMEKGGEVQLNDELVNSVKCFLSHEATDEGISNIEIYAKLVDCVLEVFGVSHELEWLKKKEKDIVISYLMKQGYSKSYKKDRDYLIQNRDAGINSLGWITKDAVKNKEHGYKKFIENSSQEDDLLAANVDRYEKTGGFYFSQMLNRCLKEIFDRGLIPDEIRKKYIEKQAEIDTLCSVKKWPTSFSDIYLSNNKTERVTKYLDKIVEEIYKIRNA